MDPATGRLSEIAAVFYLKELKEVSEQTGDAVKYVCDHEVPAFILPRSRTTQLIPPVAPRRRSSGASS